MSAKLTVIFYIIICFEIGLLLIFIPWVDYWNDNFFLYYAASHLHWQHLIDIMHSGYMRGAVSGLGISNIIIGFWEIKNFNRTVSTISEDEKPDENVKTTAPSAAINAEITNNSKTDIEPKIANNNQIAVTNSPTVTPNPLSDHGSQDTTEDAPTPQNREQ